MKNILIGLSFAIPLYSYAITGNDLYELITNPQTGQRLEGARYLQGLRDAENYHVTLEEVIAELQHRQPDKRPFWCSPNGATIGQMQDIVKAHLEKNPQNRHINAAQLASQALVAVWPCSNNP